MGELVSYDHAVQYRQDREVFALYIKAIDPKDIAEQLKLSIDTVYESISRCAGGITQEMITALVRRQLAQLDKMFSSWWDRAQNEPEAAMIELKIMERLAKQCGTDKSPADSASFQEQTRDREKSTAALDRAIAFLTSKREATYDEATDRMANANSIGHSDFDD